MPTQYEQADALVQQLLTHNLDLVRIRESLARVLDEAQNEPPEGCADGTVSRDRFTQLRSLERLLRDLGVALCFHAPATFPTELCPAIGTRTATGFLCGEEDGCHVGSFELPRYATSEHQHLRRARLDHGHTIGGAARAIGLTSVELSEIERGARRFRSDAVYEAAIARLRACAEYKLTPRPYAPPPVPIEALRDGELHHLLAPTRAAKAFLDAENDPDLFDPPSPETLRSPK